MKFLLKILPVSAVLKGDQRKDALALASACWRCKSMKTQGRLWGVGAPNSRVVQGSTLIGLRVCFLNQIMGSLNTKLSLPHAGISVQWSLVGAQEMSEEWINAENCPCGAVSSLLESCAHHRHKEKWRPCRGHYTHWETNQDEKSMDWLSVGFVQKLQVRSSELAGDSCLFIHGKIWLSVLRENVSHKALLKCSNSLPDIKSLSQHNSLV